MRSSRNPADGKWISRFSLLEHADHSQWPVGQLVNIYVYAVQGMTLPPYGCRVSRCNPNRENEQATCTETEHGRNNPRNVLVCDIQYPIFTIGTTLHFRSSTPDSQIFFITVVTRQELEVGQRTDAEREQGTDNFCFVTVVTKNIYLVPFPPFLPGHTGHDFLL